MRPARVLALLTLSCSTAAMAKPAFDPAFTSSMVLQRDREIPVRGTAGAGARVIVELDSTRVEARADKSGRWVARLPARPAGGSHRLTARDADGAETLEDVTFGDVWLCSGQSNMEFTLRHATNADVEVAQSTNADLRLFNMPRQSSTSPQARPSAPVAWQRSSPETAADFSAACWFMGRELQQHQGIPIGLIASSWGGSVIEDWLDRPTLAKVPRYADDLALLDSYAKSPETGHAEWGKRLVGWLGPRLSPPADAAWKPVPKLSFWEEWGDDMAYFDGIGYYRARVSLTAEQAGAATLAMGAVDDLDVTRVNGRVVGENQGWNTPRRYALPAGTLKAGENVIEITAIDSGGGGGIWGNAPALVLADGSQVALTGFEFARGVPIGEVGTAPGMPWIGGSGRTTLFNGMIAPLGDYPVKGFAWYQGESNVGDPQGYRQLLPLLAGQWRARFGGTPFVMVQLANFGPLATAPSNDSWGRFRDAQRRIAEADPQVGLASAVDVGQPSDIHPTDKLTVGQRLALEARRLGLGEPIVSRGPTPLAARRTAEGIAVSFANGPLAVMGGDLAIGFELCDAAGKCRFVSGRAVGDSVILPGDPAAREVRYLWQASPIVNLYNAAKLPATPFGMTIED